MKIIRKSKKKHSNAPKRIITTKSSRGKQKWTKKKIILFKQ